MTEEPGREEAMAQAMRWLARREYGVRELERRLLEKGHGAADTADVLEDLASRGLVNDRRFAESLLRSRVERGYGPLKVAYELRNRGVDESLVDEILASEEDRWLALLEDVWRKRFGTPPENYREWAAQARKLQSRGFTADQVRRVIPDIES